MKWYDVIYWGLTFGLAMTGAIVLGLAFLEGGTITLNTNQFGEALIEWFLSLVWMVWTLLRFFRLIIRNDREWRF